MTDSAILTTPEADNEELGDLLLDVLPPDGSTIGNLSAREALSRAAERPISEAEYEAVRNKAFNLGLIRKGRGRGGSIALAEGIEGGSRYETPSAPTPRRSSGGNGVAAPEPTFQIGQKLSLSQIESFLWKSAGILRGRMDASELRDYIFRMLFLKRLSDAFDEAREGVIQYYLDKGQTQEQAEALAESQDEYLDTFFVPQQARWSSLKDRSYDIGTELNKATKSIEEHNPILEGVLVSIDFNNKNRLNDRVLGDLVSHFSTVRLRNEDFDRPDLLGATSEYLIEIFADSAGKKGGEFYTPSEVGKLLVSLLKPRPGMKVYDPTCGSGGMLVQSRNYLADHGENPAKLLLFGQEINLSTWAICKLNMFLHGVFSADIHNGDTLGEPHHVENGEIMQFDRVIANPPFSMKNWGRDLAEQDWYGRYRYGIPPKDASEMAFVQHMIASLNQEGVMGVVVPHGVLFRGGQEGEIRKGIVEDDLVEAVIGLPSGLFYGTGIPAALLIINKKKEVERTGKVLIIDAAYDYEKRGGKNILRDQDIENVVACYTLYAEIEDYSRAVTIAEIAKRDYSLAVSGYVDASPESAQVKRLLEQYHDYEKKRLGELILEVSTSKSEDSFPCRNNSIYVSRQRSLPVSKSREELSADHKDIIEIALDPNKISSEYASIYLGEGVGKIMLDRLYALNRYRSATWNQFAEIVIAVPSTKTQRTIVEAKGLLDSLRRSVADLEKEIVFSPNSAHEVADRVGNMLQVVGKLSAADKIMSMIRQGESATIEFKATFSLDVRHGTREKRIEDSAMKTIVAFLNSDGGCLMIGVDDEGTLKGMSKEIIKFHKAKTDKFLLHFKNQIKTRVGEACYPFLDYGMVGVRGKEILLVDCKRSKRACYLDGSDFYVRTNPATDKLDGPKLVEYVNNHFGAQK